MESLALMTARLPLPTSGYRSKPLSPASFTRAARRLDSVPFSSGSGSVVLLSRRSRDYAGVGSLVSAAASSGDTADAGSESILLSVQGMMCDGCAASVKRILESQPEVTSATVDFKKASAVVWTTDEAKGTQDWQKQYGEKLAKHLGTCGFESRLQE
ncbi:copper-transporting ATPase PAA1, chloroplastic-like [Miscanthus floridulus]|uniref:copper-transporting ATPase PAA1, chloroplastic-like n=1 Tax=Miscanthus floridulus TaxID=154761 RepID=UPI003457931B